MGLGFWVWDFGFEVLRLGVVPGLAAAPNPCSSARGPGSVWGVGFRFEDLEFAVEILGSRVSGVRLRVWGSEFRV